MTTYRPTVHNALILEATSLFAILKEFNAEQRALEQLFKVFDKVVIPDQVFYEMTAIAPASVAQLKQELRDAAAQGDDELRNTVERYVRASPRTGDRGNTGEIAKELRSLLHFVAKHPDSLMETGIGKAFSASLMADHAMLMPEHNPERIHNYCPSRGDVQNVLETRFNPDNLRVHVGEIYQMGLMDDTEFDRRMSKVETAGSHKRRFITLRDFLAMGVRNQSIPAEVSDHMLATEQSKDPYLHVGQLRRCMAAISAFHGKPRYDIDQAAHVSRMNMEQYLHSGLMPLELMGEIAKAIGFTLPPSPASQEALVSHLHAAGFFEHAPTIGELRVLADGFSKDARFDMLRELVRAPQFNKVHSARFDQQCKNPQPQRESSPTTERFTASAVGVAYEKTFAEAMVAGVMRFDEFFTLVEKTGAMTREDDGLYATRRHDVMIRYHAQQPLKSEVYVRQAGFMARSGSTCFPYPGRKGVELATPGGKPQKYWVYSAEDLIRLAQQSPGGALGSRYHRAFDAMLFHAADRCASRLHAEAHGLLGEERLVQLEKDFSNRHYRHWHKAEGEPAFTSTMATLHVRRRMSGKHLGEIASAECAVRLANTKDGAEATTAWIANHDKSITEDAAGRISLSADILRQRTEMMAQTTPLLQTLAKLSTAGRVQVAPTFQALAMLAQLEMMEPRFQRQAREYGGMGGQPWQEFVQTRPKLMARSAS